MASILDQLCINTIRTLSIDGVQKAKSGHPGMPMGMAPTAYMLWTKHLNHNPANMHCITVTALSFQEDMDQCSSIAFCISPVMIFHLKN